MSEGAIVLIIFGSMFPALLIVAIVVKLREIREAKSWIAVPGKVVKCGVASQKKKPGDPGYGFHDTDVTNEPLIEYEYKVGGKKFRGQHITIGDKIGDYELESYLTRYPVGTEVTVYYDPANPHTAVLERDFPAWVWWAGIGCVAISIAVPLLAALAYFVGVDWLKPHLANPNAAPFVTAASGFGLVALLFAVGLTGAMWKASRWPAVRGRIVSSGVESYVDSDADGTRTMHKPSVVYQYEVNGRTYLGDRVTIAASASASMAGMAKRLAARYPLGSEVTVRYNPKRPSDSVLRPWSLLLALPWAIAAIVLWFAWAAGSGRL